MLPYVASLSGEWDIANHEQLAERLSEAVAHPDVIIDLTEVSYLDSTALREVVTFVKRRAGMPDAVFVVPPESRIRLIWDVVRFNDVLKTVATIADAHSALVAASSN